MEQALIWRDLYTGQKLMLSVGVCIRMKLPQFPVQGFLVAALLFPATAVWAQNTTASSPAATATATGPLHFVPEWPNALAIITKSAGNSSMTQGHGLSINASAQNQSSAPPTLEIIGPLPVYDISNLDTANNLRTMAAPSIYNYFVESGGKQVAVANMLLRRGGLVASGMQFSTEEPNAATLKTLAALDKIRAGSYEVRFLRVQFCGLNAIWLKSLHDATDYIYVAPYGLYATSNEYKAIQPDKLYTLDDFIKALLPIIQQYNAPNLLDSNGFG